MLLFKPGVVLTLLLCFIKNRVVANTCKAIILNISELNCKQTNIIKIINLKDQPIYRLKDFEKFTSLMELSLKNCNVEHIDYEVFIGMNQLKDLQLSYNQVKSLNNETFGEMLNLKKLLIDNNDIESIYENTFKYCTELMYVRLEINSIKSIDQNAFPIDNQIRKLDVSQNLLRDIQFIHNLNNVEDINLSKNHIEYFDAHTLNNLTKLVYLNLNNNLLKILPPNAFDKCIQLKHLYIANNYLSTIDAGTLNLNLILLDLNDNRLMSIHEDFRGTKEVCLERNLLSKLDLPDTNLTLHIDGNNWECDFIRMLHKNRNILLKHSRKIDDININGISCSTLTPSGEDNQTDFGLNTIVISGGLVCILLVFGIIYFYCKIRNKSSPQCPRSVEKKNGEFSYVF